MVDWESMGNQMLKCVESDVNNLKEKDASQRKTDQMLFEMKNHASSDKSTEYQPALLSQKRVDASVKHRKNSPEKMYNRVARGHTKKTEPDWSEILKWLPSSNNENYQNEGNNGIFSSQEAVRVCEGGHQVFFFSSIEGSSAPQVDDVCSADLVGVTPAGRCLPIYFDLTLLPSRQ